MENKVESFNLDHTKVTAPYVRLAKVIPMESYTNKNGDIASVSKFDIRFTQPNKKFMPNDALHSLEHLLVIFFMKYSDELIDISPMGCRTGFYLTVTGKKTAEWVTDIIIKCLNDVLNSTDLPGCSGIPGCSEVSCGNYLEHDLDGAKLWAKRFLQTPREQLLIVNRK